MPRIPTIVLYALIGLVVYALFGCVGPAPRKVAKVAPPPMPPLYQPAMQGKALVPPLAVISQAPQTRAVVEWTNPESPFAAYYVTGLERSSDLAHWSEVARLPYQTSVSITLTNTAGALFFRTFNSFQ